MPNHVTNILTIKGNKKEVEEAFNFIKADYTNNERSIDFNKITPMPRWIYGSSPDVNGISITDMDKYGEENCALKWSTNNWGTKWNAYTQRIDPNKDNTIIFHTAWDNVASLMQKIAWIFPNLTIEYSYSDEDLGYNLGRIKMKDVYIFDMYFPEGGSKGAYQLAFEIHGYERPQDTYMVYNPDIDNYVEDEYPFDYDRSGIYPITFINEFRDKQGRIPPVIFVK